MPELPEVETIRRQLNNSIVGSEIVSVEVREMRCYVGTPIVVREKISEITRQGKYLFVKFVSGRGLQIHLKMTGRLVIDQGWYEHAKHTRVVLRLLDKRSLYYWDTRMFGYIQHELKINEAEERVRETLGPEPWGMDEESFRGKLQRSNRAIKNVILDQKVIAGVGNIYANDALWTARINPFRKSRSLNTKEAKVLLEAIKQVLERGLVTGGASDNSYVDALGKKGSYQDEFLVYGRKDDKCHRCKNLLKYGKVGGRGTWWCEECQV